MAKNEVTWAMIGTGAVTEVKSGPGLYKADKSRLKGVYSNNQEQAESWAKRHGVEKAYKDLEELYNDPEVDAVYIAVPPKFHKDYALDCLEHGKIPYVEKPLALTYEEGLEVMAKSEETGIPVYVAFYRRSMEKYKFIKDLIDQGELGQILTVSLCQFMPADEDELAGNLHWRVVPEQTLGGKFVDMVTHVLDVVQYFFGDITYVEGIAKNNGGLYKVEDTVAAVFGFASGVIGSGSWSYVSEEDEEIMHIAGTKGTVKTTGLFSGPVEVTIGDETKVYDFEEPVHVSMPYIQDLVYEILGEKESPADTKSALNSLKVTDKILAQYREENY